MSTRTRQLTIEQLERMTTHELAELLSNVVLLLRRLPDVEWQRLLAQNASGDGASTLSVPSVDSVSTSPSSVLLAKPALMPVYSDEAAEKRARELEKHYKKKQLQDMAKNLNVIFTSKDAVKDLAMKIAERELKGHSDQYAIGDL